MTEQNIIDILKMRIAVYQTGIRNAFWNDINKVGASEMMNYLFPKTGNIAYYNLILELMQKEHNMFTGGAYFLFKMPIQIEKDILDYLKREKIDIQKMVSDEESYLKTMDIISTDHSFSTVNIGTFSVSELDNILRLCASHYRYSFLNNVKSFPYFE